MCAKRHISIPLALKWRPKTFKDIVGNVFQIKVFQISAQTNDIANAYFLSGTRGCGKTSTARIFAKAINCINKSSTGEPCLKCDTCVSIENDTNFDIVEVDAASENSIENIRRITESAYYSCTQALYKVYIIDECHSLTTQAANALLKTLEEPPDNVVFVFCTTEPEKVIDTIMSRCLVCRFKNIALGEITERLKFISEQEKISITDEALGFVARYAKGGLRDAITFLDQLSRHKQEITMDFLREALSLINEVDVFEFIQLVIDNKEAEAAEKAIDLSFDKPILDFASAVIEVLEKVYLFKLGLIADSPDSSTYGYLSSKLSRKQIIRIIGIVRTIVEDSKHFFLLSQKSIILYFVSQLFEVLNEADKTIVAGVPIVSNSKIQKLSDAFEDLVNLSDRPELLTKFGLDNERSSI